MSHLLREHAPITSESWERIDQEARERLAPALAARKLVDFAGPHGWQHSATNLGRVAPVKSPFEGVSAEQRRVLPLVELRAAFAVRRSELADADRGAEDTDFDDLDEAAHRLAVAENRSVFHGWKAAGIAGIADASPHAAIALGSDCNRYARHVAKAVELLLASGVEGPYGLALGPAAHEIVLESAEAGRSAAARPPPQDPRRPARVGARSRRRRRPQPARRRLPVRLRRGHLDRLLEP